MASLWQVELLSGSLSFIEELAVPRALAVECSWGVSCCVTVIYPLENCQSFDISYFLGDQIFKKRRRLVLSGEARNRVALKNKHETEAVKECTPCEWVSFGLAMCMLGAPLLCSEVSSDLQEY